MTTLVINVIFVYMLNVLYFKKWDDVHMYFVVVDNKLLTYLD